MDKVLVPLMCPICHKPIDCCSNDMTSELTCENCIHYDATNFTCKKEKLQLDFESRATKPFCNCSRLKMIRYIILKDIENNELWYENRKLEAKILWQTSENSRENELHKSED